ncbi:MAG: NupC/NupG family nucleoside CNT transporter [Opitutales bacterium]
MCALIGKTREMLISLLGYCCLIVFAWLCSSSRKDVNWRTVGGAIAIQITLGALVLYVPAGKAALERLSAVVAQVIAYGDDGIRFLFGGLTDPSQSFGFVFAFKVLPVIIFFSSLISVLYYIRVMPVVVQVIGGAIRMLLGTSRAESLSATANIFVGQTEAPLAIKPYLGRLTRSEFFAVMCGGLASIAGSVLAGYAAMGIELRFLLAACFMAAPAGLLFAKLLMPETDTPENSKLEEDASTRPANVFDAAAGGASDGLKLALNVGAMLLAFIGLIALLNGVLGWLGSIFGFDELTLQFLLGWLFSPVAWLLGIPWDQATVGGSFIGQKLVINEFLAFIEFGEVKETFSARSQAIITFALCGFANFSSIAILLGGLGSLVPERRQEIAQLGLKAVLAGTLANLSSAAIAGMLIAN